LYAYIKREAKAGGGGTTPMKVIPSGHRKCGTMTTPFTYSLYHILPCRGNKYVERTTEIDNLAQYLKGTLQALHQVAQ
jgi:hypothetical protein